MDNNSPQNGKNFNVQKQENNNENKIVGFNLNLRLIYTLVVVFMTFFLIYFNVFVFNFTKFLINIYRDNNIKIEKLLITNLYIQKHHFHKNVFLLNLSLQNLVNFYNNQGLYDKAEELYERNFVILSKLNNKQTSAFYDNSNEKLAKIYSELGDIKTKLGKYQESEQLYNKAIELKKMKKDLTLATKYKIKIYTNEWEELNKIAYLKIKEKKYKEAEALLENVQNNYMSTNGYLPWKLMYNKSILYKNKGEPALAKKYAEYLIIHSPFDEHPVPDEKETKIKYILDLEKQNSFFKQNLADIYVQSNKNKEAIRLLKESLLINRNLYSENTLCILCNHYKLYELYKKENMDREKDEEYKTINYLKENVLSTKNVEEKMFIKKLNILCN